MEVVWGPCHHHRLGDSYRQSPQVEQMNLGVREALWQVQSQEEEDQTCQAEACDDEDDDADEGVVEDDRT